MNLKKIEPGMVVHVKNDEEYKELLKEAKRLGYRWLNGKEIDPEIKDSLIQSYSIKFNEANDFRYFKNIGFVISGSKTIEFSDLVLQDMTAEEVLSTISEMCRNTSCKGCYLGKLCNHANSSCSLQDMEPKVIIDACIKWKQEYEKKEPEIETVDMCRIIEVLPDGKKKCVHEEEIKHNMDTPYKTNFEIMSDILKQYCVEHDGEFIAVHETVCRVKK